MNKHIVCFLGLIFFNLGVFFAHAYADEGQTQGFTEVKAYVYAEQLVVSDEGIYVDFDELIPAKYISQDSGGLYAMLLIEQEVLGKCRRGHKIYCITCGGCSGPRRGNYKCPHTCLCYQR